MRAARRWAAWIAGCTFGVAIAVPGSGAGAVDRSLGAGVPKPTAAGAPWSAPAIRRLGRDLDAVLASALTLRGAHVGVLALDARSGRVLYAHDPDDAFVPASTFKLLTGSAALALLGPGYRFHTEARLDARGTTLVLRPGGDPLLRAADLDALATRLRGAGVMSLPGGMLIDGSEFEPAPYPPGWSWDDLVYDYAAVVSAATIEENVVHLVVRPGPGAGDPVDVRAAAPFDRIAIPLGGCADASASDTVRVLPDARTTARAASSASPNPSASPSGSVDSLDIARGQNACIVVTGTLPLDSAPQTLDAAVPNPVWALRALTLSALTAAGISSSSATPAAGPPVDASRVVWTHDGEPLSDLLADIWWPSDNLAAELLLRAIGRARAGVPGTTAAGADAERAWLTSIGIDPATLTIADGSGLSAYDRITPRALVTILQADWNGPFRDIVIDDLPLAGVRGTLAHSFTGTLAERRTFAKTGSVNHTRGLAGYLATLHHGAVTFAFCIDDWMGTQPDLDAVRAAVLSRLIGD